MGGYAAASSNNNWPYYTQLLLNVKSKGWGLGLGVLFGDTVLEIGIVRPCPSGSRSLEKNIQVLKIQNLNPQDCWKPCGDVRLIAVSISAFMIFI